MAVFSCFSTTEDANALLIIFSEVSKNDVSESGIVNQGLQGFFQTYTTSCSTRCRPLGRALNSTWSRLRSEFTVNFSERNNQESICRFYSPSLAFSDQSIILPSVGWNDAWNIATKSKHLVWTQPITLKHTPRSWGHLSLESDVDIHLVQGLPRVEELRWIVTIKVTWHNSQLEAAALIQVY